MVKTEEMSLEDAKKSGAIALFGEKYGDKVRVVSVGDYSVELCGGTHVSQSGSIQGFKIISEQGIAAGIRRIEALTSQNLFDYFQKEEELLKELSAKLKSDPEHLLQRVESLEQELKSSKSDLDKLKAKMAKEEMGELSAETVNGCSVIIKELQGVDRNGLRTLGDSLKDKYENAFVLLISVEDGKPVLMATASDGAVKKGAHAGNLIKEVAAVLGGGGGGKPQMAQAGGKDVSAIPHALEKAKELMQAQLQG